MGLSHHTGGHPRHEQHRVVGVNSAMLTFGAVIVGRMMVKLGVYDEFSGWR